VLGIISSEVHWIPSELLTGEEEDQNMGQKGLNDIRVINVKKKGCREKRDFT
jgi:hypothetical protein